MRAFPGHFDTYAGLFPSGMGNSGRGTVEDLEILTIVASDRFTIKPISCKWGVKSTVTGCRLIRQL